MALENLFIRNERSISGIEVDGVLRETTEASVRATTNPVEFGAEVSDHIIKEPVLLILDGVISDTPLGLAALTASIGGALDVGSGLIGSSEPKGQTRSQEIYRQLVALLNERQLIEIKTTLRAYEDLVFLSISVDQDKDTSQAVFFTATFTEFLLVEGAAQTSSDQDAINGDENSKAFGDPENGGNSSATTPTEASKGVILR